MSQLDKIIGALRAQLPRLHQHYRVQSLGVFGSYLRGEADRESDLDVLVDFEKAPTFFQIIALEDELTEMLGVKVDLVMKSALKPRIGRYILSEVMFI